MEESFEEVQKICAEAGIDIKLEEGQKIHSLSKLPYWEAKNWEEFVKAVSHCSVPTLGSISFSYKKGSTTSDLPEVVAEVYDDFIWSNKDYRWTTEKGSELKWLPLKKVVYYHYVKYNEVGDLELVQPCWDCPVVDATYSICIACKREAVEVLIDREGGEDES